MATEAYILEELLAVEMSRHIRPDDLAGFIGTGTGGKAYIRAVGLPAVAARLAQLRQAPDFVMCLGSVVDMDLDGDAIPDTNFEPDMLAWPGRSQLPSYDVLNFFKTGHIHIGFVSAPQVDQYGTTNIVLVGTMEHPKARFPGCLAQTEIMAMSRRVFGVFQHDKRTFVEKVDFASSAGHRDRSGLSGGGLCLVFTQYGVMDFGEDGRMKVRSIHPGCTAQDIRDNTGYVARLNRVEKPTEETDMRSSTVMTKCFALITALLMLAGSMSAFAADITIGFSQDINDIEWTEKMRKEIQEACAKEGVKLTVTDAKGSGEKAASDIEDLITLGVNAIIIQTYHADVIANATRDALDAGIPVIALSSEIPGVEVTSLITVDAVAAGRMMGEWVRDHFPDGANIVQITGKEGSLVNQNRGIGFRQVIDPLPQFKVLAELSANYERGRAMNIMEDQLQAHGDKIQVVYCHNDDMALGSIQAIEVMGYKADINNGICVVSPADGLYKEVHENVAAEKMVSGYFPAFGFEGVATAQKAINGETVEKRIIVPSEPITKANVDKYR